MKKLFCFILLLQSFTQLQAQDVTVRQGDLERRKYKNGVMLMYYGENRMIQYVAPYTVSFKNEDSEEKIAGLLKERHKTPVPYMYFEFKEGYDCNNAQSYLSKKGINKMAIRNCLDVSFKDNPTGESLQPGGGRTYWNDAANVTEERVMQLDTYGWALVNKVLEKRQEELEKNGWKRVYAEYNLAGGPKVERWVGKRITASPDSMYLAIATVRNSSFKLKAIVGDKLDYVGNPTFAFEQDFPGDALAETTPYKPAVQLSRLVFAGVSNDGVNTNNAGIIIYRKKFNSEDMASMSAKKAAAPETKQEKRYTESSEFLDGTPSQKTNASGSAISNNQNSFTSGCSNILENEGCLLLLGKTKDEVEAIIGKAESYGDYFRYGMHLWYNNDNKLERINFYGIKPNDKYSLFNGSPGKGLQWRNSPEMVVKKLGKPVSQSSFSYGDRTYLDYEYENGLEITFYNNELGGIEFDASKMKK